MRLSVGGTHSNQRVCAKVLCDALKQMNNLNNGERLLFTFELNISTTGNLLARVL